VQQRREAFAEDRAPQYLILDRDVKFSGEVATMLENLPNELSEQLIAVPGRTAWRSVGWEVVGGNCWTT